MPSFAIAPGPHNTSGYHRHPAAKLLHPTQGQQFGTVREEAPGRLADGSKRLYGSAHSIEGPGRFLASGSHLQVLVVVFDDGHRGCACSLWEMVLRHHVMAGTSVSDARMAVRLASSFSESFPGT